MCISQLAMANNPAVISHWNEEVDGNDGTYLMGNLYDCRRQTLFKVFRNGRNSLSKDTRATIVVGTCKVLEVGAYYGRMYLCGSVQLENMVGAMMAVAGWLAGWLLGKNLYAPAPFPVWHLENMKNALGTQRNILGWSQEMDYKRWNSFCTA